MLTAFQTTFAETCIVLAYAAGVAAALALALTIVGIVLLVAGSVFDSVTAALSRRWHRKGTAPRGKAARVIYERGDS